MPTLEQKQTEHNATLLRRTLTAMPNQLVWFGFKTETMEVTLGTFDVNNRLDMRDEINAVQAARHARHYSEDGPQTIHFKAIVRTVKVLNEHPNRQLIILQKQGEIEFSYGLLNRTTKYCELITDEQIAQNIHPLADAIKLANDFVRPL